MKRNIFFKIASLKTIISTPLKKYSDIQRCLPLGVLEIYGGIVIFYCNCTIALRKMKHNLNTIKKMITYFPFTYPLHYSEGIY